MRKPKIRIRTKTKSSKLTASLEFPHTTKPPGESNPSQEYTHTTYSSEIRDRTGGIRNWQNPCHHVKIWDFTSGISDLYDSLGHVVVKANNVHTFAGVQVLDHIPVPPSTVIDDLSLMAKDSLTEIVDPEADLANFIKEIAESLLGLVGNLKNLVKRGKLFNQQLLRKARKYLESLGVVIPHDKRGDLNWIWSRLSPAQKFLIYSFVIAPFLDDLRAILGSYNSALKRLKWLQRHNGKPVRKYYTRKNVWSPAAVEFNVDFPLSELCFENVGGAGHPMETVTCQVVCELVDYELDFNSQAWIVFTLPKGWLETLPGKLRVWAHLMGLDNPIGIIWEATRMSWLIDWFLSYRAKLFQRLSHLGNEMFKPAEVLSAGHSWKCKMTWKVTQHVYRTGVLSASFDLGEIRIHTFSRNVGLLTSEEPYYIRLPNRWEQLVLAWAVIEQRLLRRRAR